MKEERKGLIEDLIERRFFRYLGTYLAVSFGLLQFADFVEARYHLEENLVEKVGLFLAVLLPAFVVFIYNHGRKGHDAWRPFEKIFIPVSLTLGLVLSLVCFNNLSSAELTEEVSITSEDGSEEKRVIPSLAATKKLVSFPLKNNTGNSDLDWISLAIPLLFDSDIEQDMRISHTNPTNLKYRYETYGQSFPDPISFSNEVRIAQDLYADYFLAGEIQEVTSEQVTLKVQLSETESGRTFYETTLSGPDIFAVTDQLSKELTEQFYLPDAQDPSLSYIDLPVQDLITADAEALELYIKGALASAMGESQRQAAYEYLKAAAEKDPSCAVCLANLSALQVGINQFEEAKSSIDEAARLAQSLPERTRLLIRFQQLSVENDAGSMIRLLENWQKLYPNDVRPYRYLIDFFSRTNMLDRAKEYGELAMQRGHRGALMSRLADLYIRTDELDRAESLLQEFAERYPQKAKESTKLADVYIAKGELDKAEQVYEDLFLLGVDRISLYTGNSDVLDRQGRFPEAEAMLQDGLAAAKTVQDSISVMDQLYLHFRRLAKFAELKKSYEDKIKLLRKIAPPIAEVNYLNLYLADLGAFNRDSLGIAFVEYIKDFSPQYAEAFGCIGDFVFALGKDQLDLIQSSLGDDCKNMLLENSPGEMETLLDGLVLRLQGEHANAASKYQAYIDSSGLNAREFEGDLVDLYRLSGNLERARSLANAALLSDPNNPAMLLSTAQLDQAEGKEERARERLAILRETWSEADSQYNKVVRAKEFAAQMGEDW
ncbi:MAG: hypothetical protein KTR24_14425 [Saprospiraceae bacterium]|nr:hypothetical protein [Saprospiraceae bacterium]